MLPQSPLQERYRSHRFKNVTASTASRIVTAVTASRMCPQSPLHERYHSHRFKHVSKVLFSRVLSQSPYNVTAVTAVTVVGKTRERKDFNRKMKREGRAFQREVMRKYRFGKKGNEQIVHAMNDFLQAFCLENFRPCVTKTVCRQSHAQLAVKHGNEALKVTQNVIVHALDSTYTLNEISRRAANSTTVLMFNFTLYSHKLYKT